MLGANACVGDDSIDFFERTDHVASRRFELAAVDEQDQFVGPFQQAPFGLREDEVGLHHAWHALRIVNVADGTNEILNRGIVQRLLKGDVEL